MNKKVVLCIVKSNALLCYECTDCNDPFSRSETLRTCPIGFNTCAVSKPIYKLSNIYFF